MTNNIDIIKFDEITHKYLLIACEKYGFIPTKPYEISNIDGVVGVRVTSSQQDSDNGEYYLRLVDDTPSLYVITPNTINNMEKVQELSEYIKDQLILVDTRNYSPYDFVRVYAKVFEDTILDRISASVYPNDILKRKIFLNIYTPIFLKNISELILADNVVSEIDINSQPHYIKSIIDNPNNENMKQFMNNMGITEDLVGKFGDSNA